MSSLQVFHCAAITFFSRLHRLGSHLSPPQPAKANFEKSVEMPHTLDATDWKIIKELQSDGNLTNVALASRVGLSPPPCLRRVRALEQAGLITGYTALVDETGLGFDVTGFVLVGLHSQAETDLHAFENLVLAWPLVREAYMLSGESDYILKCVAPDLPAFQNFILNDLTSAKNVASVKTNLTIRRAKQTPGVPV